MKSVEEQGAPIGSADWIACMATTLAAGHGRLQDPPPPPSPLEAAAQAAFRRLVEIEREMNKGALANPIVVANVNRLREVYHERIFTLGKLSEAISRRAEDDEFFNSLGALDLMGPKFKPPVEERNFAAGQPGQDLLTAGSPVPLADVAEQPMGLPADNPLRARALDELRRSAEILADIQSAKHAKFDVPEEMQDRIIDVLIGKAKNSDATAGPAMATPSQAENKASAAETMALVTDEPESPARGDEDIRSAVATVTQSGEKTDEPVSSDEPIEHTKPAGIEKPPQSEIMRRVSALLRLEMAWSASRRAHDEYRARLAQQALDSEPSG